MPEDAPAGGNAAFDDPFAAGVGVGDAPNYYAVLGVRPGASEGQVRQSFHRLAKLWHPDRFMVAPPELRARAERRMRALTAAYDRLGDPSRREAYDRLHGYPLPGEDAIPAAMAGSKGHSWDSALGTAGASHYSRASHAPHSRRGSRSAPASPTAQAPANMPEGDARGAGTFLGLICLVLAIGLLGAALGSGDSGVGSDVAIGAALLLGGFAMWCFMAESAPAQVATRWMEGEPVAYARARRAATQHAPAAAAAESGGEPDEFARLVDDALASVPARFQPYLANVVVRIEAEPTEEQLTSVGVREGGLLLGLYQGVDLTRQGVAGALPEVITVFQGPIERYCQGDPRRMRRQVRRTVLHELAHHFGIDHEEMPAWVR